MIGITNILKLICILIAISWSVESQAVPDLGRSLPVGNWELCSTLNNPYACDSQPSNCRWNYLLNVCQNIRIDYSQQCSLTYDYGSCVMNPICSWDQGRCYDRNNIAPRCTFHSYYDCTRDSQCHWDDINNTCFANNIPRPSCTYHSYYDCQRTPECYWNQMDNICQENRISYPVHCSSIFNFDNCRYTPACRWDHQYGRCYHR